MYLTAHHLDQPAGKNGINAFLHKHQNQPIDNFSWINPDVSRIADEIPGVLVNEQCDILPGGNRVTSYLDIVAADSTETERIRTALEKFEKKVSVVDVGNLIEIVIDEIGIRFGVRRKPTAGIKEEYQCLKQRAIDLLQLPLPAVAEASLDVLVAVTNDGDNERYEFALSPNSKERIRVIQGPSWQPYSVGIDCSTKEIFEELHGDVLPYIIDGLTGLRVEKILELGGVTFRDAETGTAILEWPRKVER